MRTSTSANRVNVAALASAWLGVCLYLTVTSAAGVHPIEENPIPAWANAADVCKTISTCDRCPATRTRYCSYKDDGKASCCVGKGKRADNENAAVNGETPTEAIIESSQPLFVASVMPIEEDPVPAWASAADSCSHKRSCDNCPQSSAHYCHYTDNGQAHCCQRASTSASSSSSSSSSSASESASASETSGSFVASIAPVEEDPVPQWASANDMCLQIRSCDYCTPNADRYCKYTDDGKSQCCKRP